MTRTAHRGAIAHMLADPARVGAVEAHAYFPDGLLVVEDGHVADIGDFATLAPRLPAATPVIHHRNALIVPGFVDSHVHFPQTDIIAGYGVQLLDWLERYAFPAEAAFADAGHAHHAAEFFLDELLRNGTTTAMVFGTVHRVSVEALFAAAFKRNMRLVAGKVLMDRNAPSALLDTAASGEAESRALIAAWHGKGRLGYAVTPRFAPTSSSEQLRRAGQMLADHPDVMMQTHLAENAREIAWVASLFPEARDYLDVYAKAGLLTGRALFAHGVHLKDGELARLAKAGAAIAFCPTSNLFLGSGLFDLNAAERHGVTVGLGTDIGGGTSFSLLATANEAYKVCQLKGHSLDPFKAFYLATLGGAEALRLAAKIGNLRPGKEADFLVLDMAATPLMARRMAACRDLAERLFVLAMLGDDRTVKYTYVAGALAHARDGRKATDDHAAPHRA
ncbi:MAG: guanine deaminase [Pseudomonadota bacterium]